MRWRCSTCSSARTSAPSCCTCSTGTRRCRSRRARTSAPTTSAPPAATACFSGSERFSDLGVDFRPLGGSLITDFQAVNRLPDHKPPNSGQYGVNFKFYLPDLEPRHGARLLLPELHQPPAGGLRADRHAGGHRQRVSVPPMRWVAPRRRSRRVCPLQPPSRRAPRPASRRPHNRRQPERRPGAAVRHHRREHAARRRQRQRPGEQHRDLRVRARPPATSRSSRRTSR